MSQQYTKADLEQIVYYQLETLNAIRDLLKTMNQQNELLKEVNVKFGKLKS